MSKDASQLDSIRSALKREARQGETRHQRKDARDGLKVLDLVEDVLSPLQITDGGSIYPHALRTPYGDYHFDIRGEWVFGRFADIEKAMPAISSWGGNRFSGKCNWLFETDDPERARMTARRFAQFIADIQPVTLEAGSKPASVPGRHVLDPHP